MKSGYLLAALAAFAVAAPAVAGDKDQKSDKNDAPKEKKICHTDMVTGSLIAKRRICKTQAEWDQLAQATKQSMDTYVSQQNGRAPVPVAGQPN